MSTDKTLADVQPGGRVRLGGGLPEAVAQALATVNEAANDARHAGNYKVANALFTARITLSKQLLALSAQPSPGGQDGPAYEGHTWVSDYVLAGLRERAEMPLQLRNGEVWHWQGDGHDFPESLVCPVVMSAETLRALLAARQPVYVQGCDELRARTEGERAAYMEGLEEGKKIAARQPVGEPVCFISPIDASQLRSKDKTLRWTGTYWDRPGDDAVPVYLGPPAQAVDLGLQLDRYDAGLLGDGGGGDVNWWQDYIRAELDRAHEFYQDQADAHG